MLFRKKEEVLILPSGARAMRDSVNEMKAPKMVRSSKSEAKRYTRSKVGNFFYFFFIIAAGCVSILPLIYCICTSLKPLGSGSTAPVAVTINVEYLIFYV